jgi:hypothetical protein
MKGGNMKIKKLIKLLQEYNPNAEVCVIVDRQVGNTAPATVLVDFDEHSATKFGFASAMINEEKQKKKTKNVVIG